jgi:SPP1 gp7 family putative phage head morphogenesis protein
VNVFQLSRQFKADLLNRERAAARTMLASYHTAYRGIMAELDKLTAELDEFAATQIRALDAGRSFDGPSFYSVKRVPAEWLFKEKRLSNLLAQVRGQMAQFAAYAGSAVKLRKYEAVIRAEQEARELTRAALGEAAAQVGVAWNSLPAGAIESMVGTFGKGSPVQALFDSFGADAAGGVKSALVRGVALGQGPRDIAVSVRDVLGVPLTRALTISRTETMRSYREASLASYAENQTVVPKWRWTATKTARTCGMCLAMDGQEFDVSVPFGSHANCRCVPVPVTASWEDMGVTGVEESRPTIEDGPAWFDRQPEDVQRQVLGPGKFELYQAGDISLKDLVGYTDHPEWGPSRYEKSLKSVAA